MFECSSGWMLNDVCAEKSYFLLAIGESSQGDYVRGAGMGHSFTHFLVPQEIASPVRELN